MGGDGEEEELANERSKPLKLISPSETRWLVVADCVERILSQYDALLAHFSVAYQGTIFKKIFTVIFKWTY